MKIISIYSPTQLQLIKNFKFKNIRREHIYSVLMHIKNIINIIFKNSHTRILICIFSFCIILWFKDKDDRGCFNLQTEDNQIYLWEINKTRKKEEKKKQLTFPNQYDSIFIISSVAHSILKDSLVPLFVEPSSFRELHENVNRDLVEYKSSYWIKLGMTSTTFSMSFCTSRNQFSLSEK